VKVRVPQRLSQNKINEIIQSKENWITKKIEFFKQNQPQGIKLKDYISGESFYLLGKQYRLRIIESKVNSIELTRDLLLIHKNSRSDTKNILTKWFFNQAKELFNERLRINFQIFLKHYDYPLPTLKLRKMKSRWGSMSNRSVMTLNSHLIHTPIECIDYVIMHELCHLRWKSHGKRFYQLQERITPNYKELKRKLESFSGEIRTL
jgi:predicted metal-dependent hydrolase